MKNSTNMISIKQALGLDIACGEHLTAVVDDRLLWEHSMGESTAVEHVISSLPTHHRYARRLENKFKTSQKAAVLAAYMLYFVGGLGKEVTIWFESYVAEHGFDASFTYLKKLFFELRKCDSKDTDVSGKVEEGLPVGNEFHALPLLPDETEYEIDPADEKLFEIKSKIRRAGIHQIGNMGKKLFEWSRRPNVRTYFSFDDIQGVWKVFKARKKELEKYRRA